MAESSKRNAAAAGPLETISGSVLRRIFYNEDTHYFVAKIVIDGGAPNGAREIDVTGNCPTLWEGEDIKASGRWVRDPTYGLQFKAESISCIAPTSPEGLQRYLSGGLVRGIGPKLAERIVAQFGVDTLEILSHHSVRLSEVPGISKKKSQQIKKAWEDASGTRDVMIFLQGHGITTGTAAKIYRTYGANTVAMVKQNPYRLAADIKGIGFLKADEIARKMGVPVDSPLRAKAGLFYTLERKADEDGDCFCEMPDLILSASEILKIPINIIQDALSESLESPSLVNDGGRIYMRRLHRAENMVALRIKTLLDTRSELPPIAPSKAVDWVAGKLSFQLSPTQREAITTSLGSKVSVITGGPGVGKTTIIRALCEIWGAKKAEIRLLAPTGRAARRLGESTSLNAQTIHRALRFNPQTSKFTHNADNPMDGNVFIIDESSMIDLELASCLLAALPPTATLVLVGDIDQLPSVGPGNVLRDVISSGVVPVTRLNDIFRQKSGGYIVLNAHRVNEGKTFLKPAEGEESDFFFIPAETPEEIIARVRLLVQTRIPRKYNFSPLEDIQVLTPTRQKSLGADELNLLLQQVLNPSLRRLRYHSHEFRVGDRVMQIHNDYDKDVFNGDVGFVREVSDETQSLSVDFDGREVTYVREDLEDLVLAYATTIHKSQGSEYPAVVILLAGQHYTLLQRNLLYTAITRGRKLVCVVGQPRSVYSAVNNNKPVQRRTALADRLRFGSLPPLEKVAEDQKSQASNSPADSSLDVSP